MKKTDAKLHQSFLYANALRAKNAQLAEKKAVASQHRSRTESSQANSLFSIRLIFLSIFHFAILRT